MPSASSSRLQNVLFALLSFVLATGLWYFVVGRDHVETQMTVRVEYRGLPEGLVIRDGIVTQLTVHLRGSAELLRNLHSRDIVFTVDLSGVKRGANSVPLHLSSIPDFKAFEILEVAPSRLVLEVDALTERVVPLEHHLLPLPAASPYLIINTVLEPSVVTVRGPESQVNPLKRLSVLYDPTKNASEGLHEANVAIMAPAQVEVTPPVTTLRYTMEPKTADIQLERHVELSEALGNVEAAPAEAEVSLAVPEAMAQDREYLNAVHVQARPQTDLEPGKPTEVSLIVLLPSGSRLISVEPAKVTLTLREEEEESRQAADSNYVLRMPASSLRLPSAPLPLNFSLDELGLPQTLLPQPGELKFQPVPSAPSLEPSLLAPAVTDSSSQTPSGDENEQDKP